MNQTTQTTVAFYAIFLLFVCSNVRGQVQIQPVPPGALHVSAYDAANVNVIVTQPGVSISAKLVAQISDANRLVAEIIIPNLRLQTGANIVNGALFSPNDIIYYDEDVKLHQAVYGCLPPGQYRFCVELSCASEPCYRVLLDKQHRVCNVYTSQLKQPVLLTYPSNESVISETRPTLTWVPAMPSFSSSISYAAKLVEIKSGQPASSAVLSNVPVLFSEEIWSNMLVFPSTLKPLEPGKKYAWVVTAYTSADRLYGISDSWEFEIKQEQKETASQVMIKLLPEPSTGHIEIKENVFAIEFEERYVSGTMRCNIYNSKREKIDFELREITDSSSTSPDAGSITKVKSHGTNKYIVDMRKSKVPSDMYVLEAINEKEEKFYLRFKTQ